MFDQGSRGGLARGFSAPAVPQQPWPLSLKGPWKISSSRAAGHPAQRKYLTLSLPDGLQCPIECEGSKTSEPHLQGLTDPSWAGLGSGWGSTGLSWEDKPALSAC